ncbi:MAG TPA: hypothetical protein VHP33_23365 [Polyangiaceae bacterium]|nr:hypothetical protein [Polyangiaceae bacterium]
MTPTQRVWFATLALVGFFVAFACRSEGGGTGFKTKAVASGDLDGMQLEAAGRVALESAADAMERKDLERLRMLSRWVRERAQVVLFKPNDLKALDLAIGCLDHSVRPAEAVASLKELKSGKLLIPASSMCSELEK